MDQDSVGSSVECIIQGLPIGVCEPWFDGLEPALARGMMAIPGPCVEVFREFSLKDERFYIMMLHFYNHAR